MKPERIQELRALCEGATDGPWGIAALDDGDFWVNRAADGLPITDPMTVTFNATESGQERVRRANAAFIAAARSALPEALDEIESQRRTISDLRAEVEMHETERGGGVHDPHQQLEELYAEIIRERDAARAEVAKYRETLTFDGTRQQFYDGTTIQKIDTRKVGELIDRTERAEDSARDLWKYRERVHGGEECPGESECVICRGEAATCIAAHNEARAELDGRVADLEADKADDLHWRMHWAERAERAEARLSALGRWSSIDTAPRDGSTIELWHLIYRCVVTARWAPSNCPDGTQWLVRTLDHTWPTGAFSHWRATSDGPEDSDD